MRGGVGFVGQVCDPVLELIMTRREKASPIAVKVMANFKFGVTDITVFGEV